MKLKTKTFGDCFEFLKKSKIKASAGMKKGKFPFFTSSDIQSKFIDFACFDVNGLIFGTGGNASLHHYEGLFSTSTDCLVARVRSSEIVNTRFVYHYLRANMRLLEAGFKGAGLKHISKAYIESLRFPVLAFDEQCKIAATLDQTDSLLMKRREVSSELSKLSQSIFIEMFGDPIANSKGWPQTHFNKLCSRVTVGVVVKPASYYKNDGVPALRSLNIKPGKIVMNDLVYFSEYDNQTSLKKTQLRAGDLVLVRTGQPGTAAIVPKELNGVNAIDILIASPETDKVDPVYLCEFFNSRAGRNLVLSSQRGQIQKHLNVGSLNSAPILLPPLNLQRQFASRITEVKELTAKSVMAEYEINNLVRSLRHVFFKECF